MALVSDLKGFCYRTFRLDLPGGRQQDVSLGPEGRVPWIRRDKEEVAKAIDSAGLQWNDTGGCIMKIECGCSVIFGYVRGFGGGLWRLLWWFRSPRNVDIDKKMMDGRMVPHES